MAAERERVPAGDLAIHGGTPYRTRPFGPRWVFGEAERDNLAQVMDAAGRTWRSGRTVQAFVAAFQKQFGVVNATATSSGTAAVHAAMGGLNFEPGDEVITTPATDIGTLIGVLQHNLVPVFADWAPGTFNMDAADIERRITPRTRAILVVHLFGFPCDMAAIMDVARRHGLAVVEDCAQAHLARCDGQMLGTFGDIACWSFGLKTLTTDQGGMVSAADPELAARVRGFLSKGSERQADGSWSPYARLGTYAPMTDLQAAIGLAQIEGLEEATRRRAMVAEALDDAFGEIPGVTLPSRRTADRATYYLYPYHFDGAAAGVMLGGFVEALRAEGLPDAFGPYLKGKGLHRYGMLRSHCTYGRSGFPLRHSEGVPRIDYALARVPEIDARMPGLGYFHMRNSFTEADGEDMANAVRKVARGLGLSPSDAPLPPASVERPAGHAGEAAPVADAAVKPRIEAKAPVLADFRFQDFGGRPDAGWASAGENDAAMARLLAAVGDRGARIDLGRGIYHFTAPLVLRRRRNLTFLGAGGNPVQVGTRLAFQIEESDPAVGLWSAVHCRFDGVEILRAGGGGQGPVLQTGCDETGPDGLSTNAIRFDGCSFRSADASAGVSLADSANLTFDQCWFHDAPAAIQFGAPMRSGARSVSNGLVNTVRLVQCHVFAPMAGVRAAGVVLDGCMFSACSDGRGAGLNCGAGEGAKVTNVTIRDCFAVEAAGGTLFRQGANGAGLVFENNRVCGYRPAIVLDGAGGAEVRANVFEDAASAEDAVSMTTEAACNLSGNAFGTA